LACRGLSGIDQRGNARSNASALAAAAQSFGQEDDIAVISVLRIGDLEPATG